MGTQVFMEMQKVFSDCAAIAEQTRWAIARQRIRRVCKAAQMMGYLYGSNEDVYPHLYRRIDGEITIEKVIDAINDFYADGRPRLDKNNEATMQLMRIYCRMNETEFKAEFKRVEGYEYTE